MQHVSPSLQCLTSHLSNTMFDLVKHCIPQIPCFTMLIDFIDVLIWEIDHSKNVGLSWARKRRNKRGLDQDPGFFVKCEREHNLGTFENDDKL